MSSNFGEGKRKTHQSRDNGDTRKCFHCRKCNILYNKGCQHPKTEILNISNKGRFCPIDFYLFDSQKLLNKVMFCSMFKVCLCLSVRFNRCVRLHAVPASPTVGCSRLPWSWQCHWLLQVSRAACGCRRRRAAWSRTHLLNLTDKHRHTHKGRVLC